MSLVILVTGATAGFGTAIARRFVNDGHRVIAAGRRAERLDDLRRELGEQVHPLTLDVTDTKAVDALPAVCPSSWLGYRRFVNNAGLALGVEPAYVAQVTDWDRMLATNVTGLIHLTRALLPGMIERNCVGTSSISAASRAATPTPADTCTGRARHSCGSFR